MRYLPVDNSWYLYSFTLIPGLKGKLLLRNILQPVVGSGAAAAGPPKMSAVFPLRASEYRSQHINAQQSQKEQPWPVADRNL